MENFGQGISLCDLVNWKNPILTGAFLVIYNIAFIIYHHSEMSLITVGSYKILLFSAILLLRRMLTGEEHKKCSFFEKENFERFYVSIYDNLNLILDLLRRVILLQDISELVKVLVTIFFFLTVGNLFSTISMTFLIVDYYMIFNLISTTEQYTTYKKVIKDFSQEQLTLIRSKIPKYTDNHKKD